MDGIEEQPPVMGKTLRNYIACIVKELQNWDPNDRNNHLRSVLGTISHDVEDIWKGIVQQVGDLWATYNSKQQSHVIDYAKLLCIHHIRLTIDSFIEENNPEETFHFSNLADKLEEFFQKNEFHPPTQEEIRDFLAGFQAIYLDVLISTFNPNANLSYS